MSDIAADDNIDLTTLTAIKESPGDNSVPAPLTRIPLAYSLAPFLLNMALIIWLALGLDPQVNGHDFMENGWLPAKLILAGDNPYQPNQAQVHHLADAYLLPLLDSSTEFNSGDNYNAIYPYWVLLLQTPLALLDFPVALIIWTIFCGALLLLGLYITLAAIQQRLAQVINPRLWMATLLVFGIVATLFQPTLLHFFLGQHSIIILFLTALLLLSVDSPGWLAPLAVAVATMKPQLSALVIAVALLGWLATRQWRKLVITAIATATLYLAPLLFAPSSLGDWFSVSFVVQKQSTRLIPASSSWWGLGWQLLRPAIGDWWLIVAGVLTLLTLALLLQPLRRAFARHEIASLIPLTLIITLLVTPYTIGYDQVLLLLPAAYLWMLLQSKAELARTMRLALAVTLTLLPLWQAALVGDTNHNYPRIIESVAMLGLYYLSAYAVQEAREGEETA